MICVICKDTKTKETFNCDGCKKPICKQCGNLSSSEIKVLELQRGRVMKFHCPKCRNFETFTLFQELLDSKNSTIESKDEIIRLLKEQIHELNSKINVTNIEVQEKSYAYMASKQAASKTNTIVNVPNLIIRPKNGQSVTKTKADIQNKLSPSDLNIGINNIRTTKNGSLVIKCPSRRDIDELKQAAENVFNDEYELVTTKMRKPRVKITGYIGKNKNEEEIVDYIRKQNLWIGDADELKITYIKQKRNEESTIFAECSAGLFHKFMHNKKVFIEWQRYPVYEDLSITKCFKCQGFYHKNVTCNNKIICEHCAEEHDISECPKDVIKCNNCILANNKYKTNYCVSHKASDPECPSYNYQISVLKKKIDYNT